MNLKKIIWIILLVAMILSLVVVFIIHNRDINIKDTDKLNVVVTSFTAYDFVRQIAKDKVNIQYILGPGVDAHSYEPSAQNLIDIQNADIFIYIGGNMEKWADKVLETLDTSNTKVLKLIDTVEAIEEEHVDGAEDEHDEEVDGHEEIDEHIWTSPTNSIIMIQNLEKILSEKDSNNKEIYEGNAKEYIKEIENIRAQIQDIVDNKKRDRLVFGDKMPMQYFLNEFDLTASAAFNGCSTETEPSVATITYLINKVREEKIPVVLYVELNSGKVAKTIAEETEAIAMQIQSLHNISKVDFENGETYVTLMTKNLDVLKKVLQ